jgi:hypothetical protein
MTGRTKTLAVVAAGGEGVKTTENKYFGPVDYGLRVVDIPDLTGTKSIHTKYFVTKPV